MSRDTADLVSPRVVIEDAQCGRCGSSMHWESCDGCDGGEYEVEGDWDEEPSYHTCPACNGKGGWWQCLSDYGDEPTWCDGNPRPGRTEVPCSAFEEFTVYEDGTSKITHRSWTDDLSDNPRPIGSSAIDA